MKNISRSLRKVLKGAAISFFHGFRKDPGFQFDPKAYYLTIGSVLLDSRPHYGWRTARAAAKRIDRRAFITCGSTLNRRMKQDLFTSHKRNWSGYAK